MERGAPVHEYAVFYEEETYTCETLSEAIEFLEKSEKPGQIYKLVGEYKLQYVDKEKKEAGGISRLI